MPPTQTAFTLAQLLKDKKEAYLEFLRVPSMSVGLYVLEAGASDPQQPHTEDEVYIVTGGKAKLRVADEIHPVQAGSVIYIDANKEHKFFDIEERLETLVFFAPAEYTKKRQV
jgi:mannose-6-phosphate isomerase-like protein (cupin superfamily)